MRATTILKATSLAAVLTAGGLLASAPAGAQLTANSLPLNALSPNALNPNALTGGSNRAFHEGRGAPGVDVNQLHLRAIVLPGGSGRATAE